MSAASVGIVSYGTYLPRYRLDLGEVKRALGSGSGKGVRVSASFDEDSTTMGVEAARIALGGGGLPSSLYFATTSPAYRDKTNATAVHAALGLDASLMSADFAGSARNGAAALDAASRSAGLAVLSDVRVGRPGSADERSGGDGAAAFLWGTGPDVVATLLARASVSEEFLDRWAVPGALGGWQWEERFGLEAYTDPIRTVAAKVLSRAGLSEADHVALVSPNTAVVKKAAGLVAGRISTSGSPVGHAGAADIGLALAAVLDVAGPGESILLISAADGADAFLFETTDRLTVDRQPVPVRDQLENGITVEYARYLGWRGVIDPEPPRRPEFDRPAGPPSARNGRWKFTLEGSRCSVCSFVHLPPARVCKRCGAIDQMAPHVLTSGSGGGTVVTYTVDRLAFTPSPPVVDVVIDFDDGGRFTLQLADAQREALAVGDRLDLCFRRLFTVQGVHNYFWKARRRDVSSVTAVPDQTRKVAR